MNKRINVTEENSQELIQDWYKHAKEMTIDKLPEFLKQLSEDYNYDYGTICHAITSAGIAAMSAINNTEQGGITGFQASCIMWEFIKRWMHYDSPMRLVQYNDMLYPQYEYKFKSISKNIWKWLQEKAKENLKKLDNDWTQYYKDIEQYNIDIQSFKQKYTDYDQRPEYYEHLSSGTSQEWDEYYKKKESGFEFAPQKPYMPMVSDKVAEHWLNIVEGKIPFGFIIED
jgi:hypothetical protein